MAGKPITHSSLPTLSYFDSMRIEVDGKPICAMNAETFTTWLDARIAEADKPDELKAKLENAKLDFFFLTDRWYAMLETGVKLDEKPAQNAPKTSTKCTDWRVK